MGGFFETNWLAVGRPDRGFVAFAGLLLIAFLLAASVYVAVTAGRIEPLLLATGALLLAGLSSVPAPLVSDPVYAGPRYYFLPFVTFSWTLISIVRNAPRQALAIVAAVLLGLSVLNLASSFSRSKETTAASLSWRAELEKCALSTEPVVHVPIYFDGSVDRLWTLDLTPEECRRVL